MRCVIAIWREYLCDISWFFMHSLSEYLARRANEEDRSIVRMQVSHQFIDTGKGLTFSGFKFGDRLLRRCIRDIDLKRQTALIRYAQHQQTNGVRDGQAHRFQCIRGAFFGGGVK